MADLEELASRGSPSAATALGSSQSDVRDMAMCTAIKCGTLKVGLSTAAVVYGMFQLAELSPSWRAGRGR